MRLRTSTASTREANQWHANKLKIAGKVLKKCSETQIYIVFLVAVNTLTDPVIYVGYILSHGEYKKTIYSVLEITKRPAIVKFSYIDMIT
jgi:hypothetical protein